ncbi:MAG: 16S rRNA (guanine(966)-N(2))-methyltransferase RsmD [Lactobacillales bacterium]|jgi:16S rRNA (guanine966-N2)-methyltransferase|nr:16S rRNA (guanine(966)-N(2))-methyltransferase RsmD [Lactobacillales bacterium]
MRVISGDFRGRRLFSLTGKITRPTTDKVKESIFNMVGPYFNGGTCLDLFAGSGSLGIEAISRGMDQAILVDHSFQAMKVIRENVLLTKSEGRFSLVKRDADLALSDFAFSKECFDLVFLDPPYKEQKIEEQLNKMQALDLLSQYAIIVAETNKDVVLPEKVGKLVQYRKQVYGGSAVQLYSFKSL